jgi:hypothetical protein
MLAAWLGGYFGKQMGRSTEIFGPKFWLIEREVNGYAAKLRLNSLSRAISGYFCFSL